MKPYLILAAALLLLGTILLYGTIGDPDEASRADENGTPTDGSEEPTARDTPTLRGQPKPGDDAAAAGDVGPERRVHSTGPGRIVGRVLTILPRRPHSGHRQPFLYGLTPARSTRPR